MEFLCRHHGLRADAKNKRELCLRLVLALTGGPAGGGVASSSASSASGGGGGVPSSGAPSPRFQVYVQHGSATFTLDAPASYDVRIIKFQIQGLLGISSSLQRLTFEDVELEDGMTLGHYNIQNGSTLFLYVEGEEPEAEEAEEEEAEEKSAEAAEEASEEAEEKNDEAAEEASEEAEEKNDEEVEESEALSEAVSACFLIRKQRNQRNLLYSPRSRLRVARACKFT